MYLALHRGSWMIQKQLRQLLLTKLLTVYEVQEADYNRLLELMEQYQDRPMDLADATLVLAAEKTGYRHLFFCPSTHPSIHPSTHSAFPRELPLEASRPPLH